MKKLTELLLSCMLLCAFTPNFSVAEAAEKSVAAEDQSKESSRDELQKMLNKRVKTGMMMGSFYAYGNLLYCTGEEWMATTNKEVAAKQVQTAFPDFYKPTLYELFEAAARQTGTSFKHGEGKGWMFEPPAMPLPFKLKIADGWRSEERDNYVAYIPKEQPVGMDVYMFGRYSGLSDDEVRKFRADNAMRFARMIQKSASLEAMKIEQVGDCEALFFESEAPQRGVLWRQWSFAKDGRSFVIVSALNKENSEKLFPQVLEMVRSFKMYDPEPKCTGLDQETDPAKIIKPRRVNIDESGLKSKP